MLQTLIDRLHLAQQTAFLEFLVIEYLLENLLIHLSQEALEWLLHDVQIVEVKVKLAVEEDVVEEMRWKLDVSLLDVMHQLFNLALICVVLEDVLDQGVKKVLASSALPFRRKGKSIHEDHVMVCQPVSLRP